jgi:hypothetical protein
MMGIARICQTRLLYPSYMLALNVTSTATIAGSVVLAGTLMGESSAAMLSASTFRR